MIRSGKSFKGDSKGKSGSGKGSKGKGETPQQLDYWYNWVTDTMRLRIHVNSPYTGQYLEFPGNVYAGGHASPEMGPTLDH